MGSWALGFERFQIAEQRGHHAHTAGRFCALISQADEVFRHPRNLNRVLAVGDLKGDGCQALHLDGVCDLICQPIGGSSCRHDLLGPELDRHHDHLHLAGFRGREFLEGPEHAVGAFLVIAGVVGPDELHARGQLRGEFDRFGGGSAGLVARARSDASARKLTLATLPTSPSAVGMTSTETRD